MRTPSHLSHCVILELPLDIFYIFKSYKTYVLATFVIQGGTSALFTTQVVLPRWRGLLRTKNQIARKFWGNVLIKYKQIASFQKHGFYHFET